MTEDSISKTKTTPSRNAKSRSTRAREPVKTDRRGAGEREHPALDDALRYAKEGHRVFPLLGIKKVPAWKGWIEKATTDPKIIRQWAEEYRRKYLGTDCNFGMVTGEGYVVIDVDDLAAIPKLKAMGLSLPSTRTHATPREGGGLQFIYKLPRGYEIHSSASVVVKGVDIKGWHSFAVLPGSMHTKTHGRYTIKNDVPVADLPEAWLKKLAERKRRKPTTTRPGNVPEGERNDFLFRLGAKLRHAGLDQDEIEAALLVRNSQFDAPLAEREVHRIAESDARYDTPADIQAALNSDLPKVMLPGNNRPLAEVAEDFGKYLRDQPIFLRNREAVMLDHHDATRISAQCFRSLVARHVVCLRQRQMMNGLVTVTHSLSKDESEGVLAAPQFWEQLRPLTCVNTCKLPVRRENGNIELPPDGYDEKTAMLTIVKVRFDERISFKRGRQALDDLFGEFEFTSETSRAVAVAALIGMFAKGIIPQGTQRPVFIFDKNAEGAGATTLARCVVGPVCGPLKVDPIPEDNDEMRKKLTAVLREGRVSLVFDNAKNMVIGGSAIESLTSTAWWTDRILGSTQTVSYPNNVLVIFTVNGAMVTSDMRRRSLISETHQSWERPEDRVFKRPINDAVMETLRPQILAACWAMVRHWDQKGRPKPSRSHSAFPEWAEIVGGIVETAGFACPFTPQQVGKDPDEDAEAMRTLVDAMEHEERYSFKQLIPMCGTLGIFEHLIHDDKKMNLVGNIFKRFYNRPVGDALFMFEGKFHQKRYWVIKKDGAKGGGLASSKKRKYTRE